MDKTYIAKSLNETLEIAKSVGENLKKGDFIAYFGGLGAGKTAFTRGIASGLGIDAYEVSSPTFSIVNEYICEGFSFCHFDMYRILNEQSLETTGFFDYLDGKNIIATEWTENIVDFMPKDRIEISIKVLDENSREIHIKGDLEI